MSFERWLRRLAGAGVVVLALTGLLRANPQGGQSASAAPAPPRSAVEPGADAGRPDFARMVREQADTDRTWRAG